MSVVWTCHIFKDNFGMKHEIEKHLKESCRFSSDEQLPIKYFLNIAFFRGLSTIMSGGFDWYGLNGLNKALHL